MTTIDANDEVYVSQIKMYLEEFGSILKVATLCNLFQITYLGQFHSGPIAKNLFAIIKPGINHKIFGALKFTRPVDVQVNAIGRGLGVRGTTSCGTVINLDLRPVEDILIGRGRCYCTQQE